MGFREFRQPELQKKPPHLPDLGTLPIYYIDGILSLGSGEEFAETLYSLSCHKRKIYCSQDSRNQLSANEKGEFPKSMHLPLDEQATIFADAICDTTDFNQYPNRDVSIVI